MHAIEKMVKNENKTRIVSPRSPNEFMTETTRIWRPLMLEMALRGLNTLNERRELRLKPPSLPPES